MGLIIDRLEVMWRIARSRYTVLAGFQVPGLTMEAVKAVMSYPIDEERGFSRIVQKMSAELLYIIVPESPSGLTPMKGSGT